MKKTKNSFQYIGAALTDNSILATEISKDAYNNLLFEAERIKNTPYSFSRGNIFEFIEGAKLQVASAERGKIFNISPVNAARGEFQSPDDLSFFYKGTNYCFQAKVSEDPYWIIESFSKEKYNGMYRITTSDMYEPVKRILEEKKMNGSITKEELDTLNYLRKGVFDPESKVMVSTSNEELDSLCGENGKIDLFKVENYIQKQQNLSFINECLDNTTSVTFVSTIFGCVYSSVKNLYKYIQNKQDIKETATCIFKDTLNSAGSGLFRSTIANMFKYVAYQNNSLFFRDNVNALVIANGTIDLTKTIYHFYKGELSYNDLINNIICLSFITLSNIGINYILAGNPLLKLASTIIINQVLNSFKINAKENSLINKNKEKEILYYIEKRTLEVNREFEDFIKLNIDLCNCVLNISENFKNYILDEKIINNILDKLNLKEEKNIYNSFINDIESNKEITIQFKRRKNYEN